MVERYEREGFRENEGSNSWWHVLGSMKKFFKYIDDEWWDYDGRPEFFHWGLSGREIRLLNLSINSFSSGCSAPFRKIINGLPRLGPFKHISLWFPSEHGEHRFPYEYDSVRLCKEIIVEMMTGLFPDYQIGYFFRTSYQPSGGGIPEMHVHIVLSTIIYPMKDREYLETFNSLDRDVKPYHSLYFLTKSIPYTTDLAAIIEPRWRDAIKRVTGRKVRSEKPLAVVTGKDGQDILDRYRILRYIANQALHTFSKIKTLTFANDGKVVLEFKPHHGVIPKPFAIPQIDFVRKYLIMPQRTYGIQFRGRGFLCGRAAFAPVADAASRLVLNPCEKGKPRKFLFDLPVAEIKERAIAARRCLEDGDTKGFRSIRAQYRLGDPLRELEILLDLDKQKRLTERTLNKRLDRKNDVDDSDLLALA